MGTINYLKANNGSNYFHIAVFFGHLTIFKKLIDKEDFNVNVADNDVWTILHYSARNGSYELLKYLVDKETDIDPKNKSGWNCLHIPTLCGHLYFCKKLINQHNFNVNLPDNEGWKAFHFSARNGKYQLFSYFLDIGTDIHLKNNSG